MSRPVPTVRIVRQPSSVYRMRYEKEKRTTCLYAESTPQDNSAAAASSVAKKPGARKAASAPNTQAPLYPKIEIVNGKGPGTLIVSCVNKTAPHHVHPHKLTGANCKSGVAIYHIGPEENQFELTGISIQFTKQTEIEKVLEELKSKNVDPFNGKRLGFYLGTSLDDQVYLRDSLDSTEIIRDRYHILEPVVSNPISNSSRKVTLLVEKTSHLYSTPDGANEVTVFMKKLEKDQKPLMAKFYTDNWSKTVEIKDIHYKCAFVFNPPRYTEFTEPIQTDMRVSLKFFVPFANEEEKKKFMKQSREAEEGGSGGGDETEDGDPDTEMTTENSNDESAQALDTPDGKYESAVLDFTYKPSAAPSKLRNDNQMQNFDANEPVERDGQLAIREESRRNLANRAAQVLAFTNPNQTTTIVNPLVQAYPPAFGQTTQFLTGADQFINHHQMVDQNNNQVVSVQNSTMETTSVNTNFYVMINPSMINSANPNGGEQFQGEMLSNNSQLSSYIDQSHAGSMANEIAMTSQQAAMASSIDNFPGYLPISNVDFDLNFDEDMNFDLNSS